MTPDADQPRKRFPALPQRFAQSTLPAVRSIDRYYAAHGRCPSVNERSLAELRKILPQGLSATLGADQIEFRTAKAVTGWSYFSADNAPGTCQLRRKLGWDPALVWWRSGDQAKWIFVPGDGSDEKPIDLDIGG